MKQSRFRADEGVERGVGVSEWGFREGGRVRKDVPSGRGPDSHGKQYHKEGRVAFPVDKSWLDASPP